MSDVMEIIKGISQAMAMSHDGAKDKDGKSKTNLKRDKEYTIHDRRMVDAFKVRFQGNLLVLSYSTELTMEEMHDKKLEDKIGESLNEALKFIKDEYKSVTGKSLALKETGNMKLTSEYTSRVRCWATAVCTYEIGGITKNKEEERDLEKSVKDWLKMGKNDKAF